ncbi:hypothetical protein [Lutibacter agarilyticus]|nr:hypothetical protein [Lutibacter agarilyticus]
MYLKNFSMIKSVSGWLLVPAYDLLNLTIATRLKNYTVNP